MSLNALNEPSIERGAAADVDALDRPVAALQRGIRRRLIEGVLLRTAFWVFCADAFLVLVFTLFNPIFWSLANFQVITLNAAEVVILATGAAFLLGAAELDVSLGANIILSSVIGGEVMTHLSGSPAQVAAGVYPHLARAIVLGILACVATGMAMGLMNGLIVTVLGVNSFITTLATLGIASGTAYLITNGADLAFVPTPLQTHFGVATVGPLPLPAIVAAVVVLALAFVLAKTRFGLHTLALGSSREAARRAGLRVERHVVSLFVIVGGLVGLASIIDLSRFATTNVSGHQTDALAAIAAAVIGGTSMFGGKISILGAVTGSLLSVILADGLVIVGLPSFYQLIIVGVVLIIAVHLDHRRTKLG